jgi:hypothetical protein
MKLIYIFRKRSAPLEFKVSPRGISRLSTIASPTSFPPVMRVDTAPGMPFFSSTPEIIFVTAMEQSGVVGEGFHTFALPATSEREKFLHLIIE